MLTIFAKTLHPRCLTGLIRLWNFVLVVLVSWGFLICRLELFDTPTEYGNNVQNMRTLLKIREFAAQQFLQNCYWPDLLKVCKIFSIFDLVMCNTTTAQKTIHSCFVSSVWESERQSDNRGKRDFHHNSQGFWEESITQMKGSILYILNLY